ncbi:MAG: hypothetical protein DCC71_03805 [Proteobacteria bacterium]|nr:MAG: hypothetical protein DCC71_03805 [Pseudomonadota bacterium]
MQRRKPLVLTALLLASFALAPPARSEDDRMGKGGMGQGGMDHGGMGHMDGTAEGSQGAAQSGPASDMPRRMQELREHSHMMNGIEDPERLRSEMRRHMKMMDDMMQAMMEHMTSGSSHGTAPAQGMGGDM